MNDNEKPDPEDGAIAIGQNIGDNLATRAMLVALVTRLALDHPDGPGFIRSVIGDAEALLWRVVPEGTPLALHTTTIVDNTAAAIEAAYETAAGLPPFSIYDPVVGGEED